MMSAFNVNICLIIIIIIIIIINVSLHGFLGLPTGSFPGTSSPSVILVIHRFSYNTCCSQ